LLRPRSLAIVAEQMQNALQIFRFEERRDRSFQIDLALGQRTIRKCRGMKMSEQIRALAQRPQQRSERSGTIRRSHSREQCQRT